MLPASVQTELLQSLFSFLRVSLMILLIVTPIIALMELLRLYKLLDPLLNPLHRLFGWMRIRKESVVALFVGIIFGIAYGGGVLLEEKRSGALNRRDALLVGIFLSLSHALIEDTLIFVAIGANWVVILLARILFTMVIMLVLRFFIPLDTPTRS
jgi:hypothetical protein